MNTQFLQRGRYELQSNRGERHIILPRLVSGLPLLAIGLAHVFNPSTPMMPLVEAADLPAAAILSPIAVAAEILAGTLLLLGAYARLGALLAIPTMAVAFYAHLVIDVWPNGASNEPPVLLPLAVLACATYVLWRGAGAWSIDSVLSRDEDR